MVKLIDRILFADDNRSILSTFGILKNAGQFDTVNIYFTFAKKLLPAQKFVK